MHISTVKPINLFIRLSAISILILVLFKAFEFPLFHQELLIFLILYSLLIYCLPYAWLIVLPALLPVFDFAPLTGRFYFSEFDLLILLTCAVNYWKQKYINPIKLFRPFVLILLMSFMLCFCMSLYLGLTPFPDIDVNSFNNYYSHYNGLRVSKSILWVILLFPCVGYFYIQDFNRFQWYFCLGILTGLTAIIFISIWERILFTGLLNFSNDYRITASFSSMHTGGGHIDNFLVLSIPFIFILFIRPRLRFFRLISAVILFMLSIYVLMVTYSRAPYAVVALQIILLTYTAIYTKKSGLIQYGKIVILSALFLCSIPAIVLPVFKGPYIQDRFSQIEQDIEIRKNHWIDSVNMMSEDWSSIFFGMGPGSYPRTYAYSNSQGVNPATYLFLKEDNFDFLRLWAGDSLYIEQILTDIDLNVSYQLELAYRSNQTPATLTIAICEKALLYSFNCFWHTFEESSQTEDWHNVSKQVVLNQIDSSHGKTLGKLSQRPLKLAIYNGTSDAQVDVRHIALINPDGVNLLHNPQFQQGMDYWFFATDNHLPWHSKNLWVQILFEQGWVGLLILVSLFLTAIIQQIRHLSNNQEYGPVYLTALSGFLLLGMVTSPFDAPRISLMFSLILLISLISREHG